MKWIEGEDIYRQETLAGRRTIDGVTHLFRAVRNRHYTTTRWDLSIVDPDKTYELRFTSLRAAQALADNYHPDSRIKDDIWESRYRSITHAGKTLEVRNQSYYGWENSSRVEQWMENLLTPLELASRSYKLALADRDAVRERLDAAEAELNEAADAYFTLGGVK